MNETKTWHGINRSELEWFPTIDYNKCDGCGLCILTCGNDVFRWIKAEEIPKVSNPMKCVVGCTTCSRVCPEDAISFPSDPKIFVRNVITHYKIFPKVKEELNARLQKFPDHLIQEINNPTEVD